MLADQPDVVVVDKEERTVVVIDVVSPADSNIRKIAHENIKKCQALKEQLEHV